jgi:hypothetical protein
MERWKKIGETEWEWSKLEKCASIRHQQNRKKWRNIFFCTAAENEGIQSKSSAKSPFKMAPEERSLSSGEEGEEEEEVGRARKTTGTLPPSLLPQPYSSTDSVDGGGISSTDTYFTVCNCT